MSKANNDGITILPLSAAEYDLWRDREIVLCEVPASTGQRVLLQPEIDGWFEPRMGTVRQCWSTTALGFAWLVVADEDEADSDDESGEPDAVQTSLQSLVDVAAQLDDVDLVHVIGYARSQLSLKGGEA